MCECECECVSVEKSKRILAESYNGSGKPVDGIAEFLETQKEKKGKQKKRPNNGTKQDSHCFDPFVGCVRGVCVCVQTRCVYEKCKRFWEPQLRLCLLAQT